MKYSSLRLESLETRTLLAADLDLDQLAEQTQKVLDTFFDGDESKFSEAEAAAKKLLGMDDGDTSDEKSEKKHKKSVFSRLGKGVKGAFHDAKEAGSHFVDTVSGHEDKKVDAAKTDTEAVPVATETEGIGTSPVATEVVAEQPAADNTASTEAPAADEVNEGDANKGEKKNPLDRVGDLVDDVKDTIGGIFGRDKGDADDKGETGDDKKNPLDRVGDLVDDVKDTIGGVFGRDKGDADDKSEGGDDNGGPLDRLKNVVGTIGDGLDSIFGDGEDSPDSLLGRAMSRFDNILVRAGERGHLFDGLGERDGIITDSVARFADIASDVIEGVTGLVDNTTDFTPEQEKRIAMALDVIGAGLKGLGTVSSLVGTAVPGVSAASPILSTAGNTADNASDNVHGITSRLHDIGNKVGAAGHKVASGLDKLSSKLDPVEEVAGNSTIADAGTSSTTVEVIAATEDVVVVAENVAPAAEAVADAPAPEGATEAINEEVKNVA